MAENVGLATLGGPITGVISELVGIGSQIKDTFTGVVNKFRGIRGNRGTGDRSVDAQITATSEVTTAVQASDAAAEQRNQQLIGAISTLGESLAPTTTPGQSAGQRAHEQATAGDGTTATVVAGAGGPGGTGRPGRQSSGGGLLSRIGDNITGMIAGAITGAITSGAIAITPIILGALPATIAAVVTAGVVAVVGKRIYDAYNDKEGQKKEYGVPDGEEASPLQKARYVADKAGGVDTVGLTDDEEKAAIARWAPNEEQAAAMAKWTPQEATATDGSSTPKEATATDGSSQQKLKKEADITTGVLATALKAQQSLIVATFDMARGLFANSPIPIHDVQYTKVGRVTESGSSPGTPAPAQTTTTTSPVATTSPPETSAPAQSTATMPIAASSPGTAPAQTTAASPVATSGKKKKSGGKKGDYQYAGLGSLAEYHESRGDVGAVAPDAKKGFAYGKFQMHSGGTVGDFIKQSPWAKDFEGMKPGSKEYNEQWPKTAAKNPEAFGQAQFDFIKKTHYGPTERKAQKMGIDTTDPMLQEVLFSTGVQHGAKGGPQILDQAFPKGVDPKTLTREQIRERVYAERGRKNADGTLAHFPSLEGGIKAHNKQGNRFINENKDAAKIGTLASSEVASKIGQPIDQAMVPTAAAGPVVPVQDVATPVAAPAPETAPAQAVTTDVQRGTKGEPSIFAQAMKGVDPKTLTSEQRRDMYFAEKNRKDANGNLVHPITKAKGKDTQSTQPIEAATSPPADSVAPVQEVTATPVAAPTPEAAPAQTVATDVQRGAKSEPSIFAQALKGVDPRTLTSEQRRDMYFAEKNRKDANGNLVHPIKAKGKDAQISQPIEATTTSQPAAIEQPAPIASSQQTQPPAPAPIVQPKPEPQPVVIANSGGSSDGSSVSGGQQGGFQKPQTNRRNPPQMQTQTQKQPSIIPFEFDDIMLTLMTHDLM